MDWIKAKYDRLLLGFCGVVALLAGAVLLMKILGWKSQFPKSQAVVEERNNFGTDNAGERIAAALTLLKENVAFKTPVHNGIPISLFTSAPVMKVVGVAEPIAILVPDSKQLRAGVDNRWLYDNGLDLRQVNIADVDSDGDHFTNKEEFEADPKTNPRDAKSMPPVYVKIQYKECIKTPLSLKFNTWVSDTELTIRIIGATPESAWNTRDLKVGGEFPIEKNGTENRFKLEKVDKTIPEKEVAHITDLKTGRKLEIKIRETLELPSLSAKLSCNLGKPEEKTVNKGDEFAFEVDPDQTYTVKDVTETEVTLDFTLKSTGEKKTVPLKIPNP